MKANWIIIIIAGLVLYAFLSGILTVLDQRKTAKNDALLANSLPADTVWRGAASSQIPYYSSQKGKLIYYGYQLIANTSYYLGPHGTVAKIANGLNCQNCHLEGGTRPFAYNFGKVFATYPKYRARNDQVQSLYDRINDCMHRSMNGPSLDTGSTEMKAMYAYIEWLDKDIPAHVVRGGTSVSPLPYMDTAANIQTGRQLFVAKCQSCHGKNGEGQINPAKTGYDSPPLWGPDSYNDGAGMFRLTKIAAFVMNNMPFGTDYHHPELTVQEAWNVGAYVNSQPRPHYDQSGDWQDLKQKPIDYPYGPYTDGYSETQHKYGPYQPIIAAAQKR